MSGKSQKNDNYILSYYQGIKDGRVAVGKYIQLLYEKIVKGIENKEYLYDQRKANEIIDYFENHTFHCEGELAPNAIKLELWQKAMLSCIYAILDPKTEKRMFREVILLIGRKNGKSLIAAGVCKHEWQKSGYGAKVYVCAPKLDQADIVYNTTWQMTLLDPEWKDKKKLIDESKDEHNKKTVDDSILERHRQSDLFLPATNSMVKKIAFSAKRSDGFNPSLVVADEISCWEGQNGLRQWEVMKSGMGARPEGLMFACTTAGYINDSIYDELIKRSTRFLFGESKEKRILPFLYTIDDPEKWNDINELRKSNPNLGVSVSVDYMLEEIAIAEGSLSKKSEFLCKYCNVKQNSSLAWLPANVVNDACGAPLKLEDFRGHYCVAGIDLSQTTDLTAATIVIEKHGELYVFAKFWLPAEKIEEATARDGVPYEIYIKRGLLDLSGDNFIDYHDCYKWLVSMVEQYEILPLKVGYDRYSAQYLVQDLNGYGFQCDDVFQGDNLWGVLQEIEGLLKDKKINIGDNDLLKMHLLNSAIKMNSERGRGRLIKLSPTAHIDGVAALADAFTVRQKWHDEIGGRLQNEDS